MISTIFIEDSFDSAHFLPNVEGLHKCARMHGHTYRIRIELTGEVESKSGWIVDYSVVKQYWTAYLKNHLDHNVLNEIKGLENPTCEVIAAWIWERLHGHFPDLSKIELRETEHCGVVYEGQ